MATTKARTRAAARLDATNMTISYVQDLMSPEERAAYLQRFRDDPVFRFEVVLSMATDHMAWSLDPEDAALLTRREQAREEAAIWNDRMRVMNSFMKKRPSAEEIKTRQLTWTYLMKTYGYPALDVVTWELVSY
jgi:hypothetical protein